MTESNKKSYHYGIETGSFESIKNRCFLVVKANGAITLNKMKSLMNAKNVGDFSSQMSQLNTAGVLKIEHRHNESFYRLTLEHEVEQVIQEREQERFDRWVKYGKKNNYFNKLNQY